MPNLRKLCKMYQKYRNPKCNASEYSVFLYKIGLKGPTINAFPLLNDWIIINKTNHWWINYLQIIFNTGWTTNTDTDIDGLKMSSYWGYL